MHVPNNIIQIEVQVTQDRSNINYITGMDGHPQDLPEVMKLLNNYIKESLNNRNIRKIIGRDHTSVAFTQTQYKD